MMPFMESNDLAKNYCEAKYNNDIIEFKKG